MPFISFNFRKSISVTRRHGLSEGGTGTGLGSHLWNSLHIPETTPVYLLPGRVPASLTIVNM
jgi:hypothetical protein